MSTVKKIKVSNLKAISSLTADFNGCTAIITGGNNKGKSSFLKSLPDRLRSVKPEVILKKGEKEGFAEWELTTGERFLWEFDGKKEKLSFFSEKNIKQSVNKELSKAYFPAVFDVDEFLNSTPAKQKAVLQKLTGIDFTEIDRVYQAAYEDRTWANKKLAEEKAKLIQLEPDAPTEITPTEDLEKDLAGISAHNQIRANKFDLVAQKNKQVKENEEEISSLKERIKTYEKKNSILNSELLELDVWLDDEANQDKNNYQELSEQIATIKKQNKEVEQYQDALKQQKIYEQCVLAADQADKDVKKIEAEKADVIKNASMPDGFGFSDDGITYNGYAFTKEQLSSSGIYIAALKLAAIGLGEVRSLYFDASFLDKNSLIDIEKWATENQLQLLIERPAWEGGEITYELINESFN